MNLQSNLTLSDIKVGGANVTISTSHEKCIKEDSVQLSSLVSKKTEIKEEKIEVLVGKFIGNGVIKKPVVVEFDNSKVVMLIEIIVLDIFEWFGKDISNTLSRSLSEKIYSNYYWLKISELKLFSERIKGGYWNQMHNMSPAVLMERLEDFCNDAMELREQIGISAEIESQQNEDERFIPMSEDHKKEFTEFANKLSEKYERIERINKPITIGEMNAEIERIKNGK